MPTLISRVESRCMWINPWTWTWSCNSDKQHIGCGKLHVIANSMDEEMGRYVHGGWMFELCQLLINDHTTIMSFEWDSDCDCDSWSGRNVANLDSVI
ncbi:unnamed protein product [Ambrosiozyma monospora]|uniref:Unnamed protein product n=1 Tax=Ambrosiozyma monospora TaxID=43982 RepID=A0ACB5SV91_AMBMO|nr:unnamed protein product [Ambrosiozyma monospora]